MNEANSKYLVEHYPNLYKDYGGNMRQTCMAWGFECGDGWFELLKELSEKLEPLGVVAAQVKEKFGGLRFYVCGTPADVSDVVDKAISEAEDKSYVTCEFCGASGECNREGWLSVRCDSCRGVAQSG